MDKIGLFLRQHELTAKLVVLPVMSCFYFSVGIDLISQMCFFLVELKMCVIYLEKDSSHLFLFENEAHLASFMCQVHVVNVVKVCGYIFICNVNWESVSRVWSISG